jgi:hypothetical protein
MAISPVFKWSAHREDRVMKCTAGWNRLIIGLPRPIKAYNSRTICISVLQRCGFCVPLALLKLISGGWFWKHATFTACSAKLTIAVDIRCIWTLPIPGDNYESLPRW